MLRRLSKLAFFCGIVWIAIWGLISLLAPRLVDSAVAVVKPKLARAGLAVDSLTWGRITVAPSLTRTSATTIFAAFDLTPADDIQLRSSFRAARIAVWLDSLLRLRGGLSMEEFEVIFHETDRPSRFPFERLTDASLTIGDLPLLAPRQAMVDIRDGLQRMLVDNALVGNFELNGVVLVRIRNESLPARLYTERSGELFRLRFDESDVQTMVDRAGVDLSAEQVGIISLYPVRVPFLIEITRQARQIAWDSYPESRYHRDALRHVSWSYLLTTEFGPDFAKEVTDAQETRTGNTANERAMDYHNNAVGRHLALSGTPLDTLPRLVHSHPDVIRHPSEVDSRQELLR